MEIEARESRPWESLPMPKKWRTMGKSGEGARDEKEVLIEEIWHEWMAAHPLEGG